MDVLPKVRQTIERYDLLIKGEKVVIGVSGGPDSLCLLHVLKRLMEEYSIELHVAHLNHLIRGEEAEEDAAFVENLAREWGLPFTIGAIDVPSLAKREKLALEEAARRARYSFLAEVAHNVGAKKIAVGHNADDQTETVLMHWLRGAGLAGLRGMLPKMPLGEYRLFGREVPQLYLIRPLLEVKREEIEGYCRENDLHPRFDRSNLDTTYFRNRLRHELIPYLESYNPNIREVIRRTAQVIAADYEYLRNELLRTWPNVVVEESEEAIVFDLDAWTSLSLSLKRSTIREAIHRLRRSLRNINWVHVEDAIVALMTKPTGTQVTLPRGLMLSIGYKTFTIADEGYLALPSDLPLLFVEKLEIEVPGLTNLPDSEWTIEARILERGELPKGWEENEDPLQAFLDYEKAGRNLLLRKRLPGERFQPLGLGGHWQALSSFMINVKIPSQWRDFIPILASPEKVVWVAGWRIDERAKVTEDTRLVLHLSFRRMRERIADEIKSSLVDGKLPCPVAFKLARRLSVEPQIIGDVADEIGVKISRCQLGLFGYEPGGIVKPTSEVSEELVRRILSSLVKGCLPCSAAWDIAQELSMKRKEVSGAAEAMGIRISRCQLGCFN
jgi:tRNA(Ile)-lysidine synthase